MKKISSLLTILFAVSLAAHAQTVGTANIMGYTKVTIPSNQYALVSLNFETTNNTINDLLGGLPTGSGVQLWNATSQSYTSILKNRSGWGAGGTNQIEVGSGVFVSLPADAEETVLFSGDVLVAGTTTVVSATGYTALAFPYSSDTSFTNTTLAKSANVGDTVSFWDNGWTTYLKNRAGWIGADSKQIKIGEAFFFNTDSGQPVDEVKPYSL